MRKSVLMILVLIVSSQAQVSKKTENVILITLDGVRTQEVFGGMDRDLFREIDKDAERRKVFARFDATSPAERRQRLMPFFWKVLMKDFGSIAGNRKLGSAAQPKNKLLFSFPGYSEIVTGEPHDEIIKSNERILNPFSSFFQFLKSKMELRETEVASFASWSAMNEIVSSVPDEFTINAGYEKYEIGDGQAKTLSDMQFQTPTQWSSVRHDFYTFGLALAHAKKYRPRVLHIGLGETDDWAHMKRYDMMLDALHRSDSFLRQLWEFVSTDKHYRGRTSLIITVDHGRGVTKDDWHGHGSSVPRSNDIWIAFVSPDSNLRGEWKNTETVYQNQIAATLCRLLGFDYSEQNKTAGKPIARIFR